MSVCVYVLFVTWLSQLILTANQQYTIHIHYIVAAQYLLSFRGANIFRVDPHAPICGSNSRAQHSNGRVTY